MLIPELIQNNEEIERLIKKHDQEKDKDKKFDLYFEIRQLCLPLMKSFISNSNITSKDKNIGIITEHAIEGIRHSVDRYPSFRKYSFLSLVTINIYCATNVPNWQFDFMSEQYVWGEHQEKLIEVLNILDPIIRSGDFSYRKLNRFLENVIPSNKIIDHLHKRPKTVNYETKYIDIDFEQIKQAQDGDKSALQDLIDNRYSDIVRSVVSYYRFLAKDKIEIERMKKDGYEGIKNAIRLLPPKKSLRNYQSWRYASYIFAHITWYVFFHVVGTRVNPNLKIGADNSIIGVDAIHRAEQIDNIFSRITTIEALSKIDKNWAKLVKEQMVYEKQTFWSIAIADLDCALNPNKVNWDEQGIDIKEIKSTKQKRLQL